MFDNPVHLEFWPRDFILKPGRWGLRRPAAHVRTQVFVSPSKGVFFLSFLDDLHLILEVST